MIGRYSFLFVPGLAMALAGCTLPYAQLSLPDPITGPPKDAKTLLASKQTGTPLAGGSPTATEEPRVYPGSGTFSKEPDGKLGSAQPGVSPVQTGSTPDRQNNETAASLPTSEVSGAGITINLVNASVPEAAKTILGDVLGVNYVVSDKIKASVTLRTVHPVDKAGLLQIFQAVLGAEDIAVVAQGDLYKVLPASDAAASGAPLQLRRPRNGAIGIVNEIVPLTYVAAPEMERVLRSAAPDAGVLRVDTDRNALLLSGTQSQLNSMNELVNVFDVDWMRGMSFAILPVETDDPEAIASELDVIFANDRDSPTKGIVRFVPNRRLKSVLVISSRPEYLRKAQTWMERIDLAAQATEKQVFVYHVQNRPAAELARLLQKVYRPGGGSQGSSQDGSSFGTGSPQNGSSPQGEASASSDGLGVAAPVVTPPPQPEVPSVQSSSKPQQAADAGAAPTDAGGATSGETQHSSVGGGAPPDDRNSGISIVADEPNNSLVITATPAEYKRMRNMLHAIDIAGNQVLIEATIAEVTLTDELKFGVRWFFQKGGNNIGFNDLSSGVVNSVFPGFSYFLNVSNIKVAINALSTITDVNVVSSPTLTVVENKKAVLQVGDEVPIATQSAVSVDTPGAPIVNSVSFRNTGVILGITPRVSDDGKVVLDIEQEVSDVVPTTTSKIDSPTIQQRRVKTTVSVQDGQSIVLAGLIQDRANRERGQVPLLGNIPYVGNVFKTKDDEIKRTELIIAITPQVLRDPRQIDQVTSEYRDNLNLTTRPQRRTGPDYRETVDRLVR